MPVYHLHCLRMPSRFQKTGKTLCGAKVTREAFAAEGEDTNCPACRAACEKEHEAVRAIVKSCAEHGISTPEATRLAEGPVSYQHAWFL